MKSAAVLLSLSVILGGCAKATKIYDAQGNPALLIECHGIYTPLSACYNKAAKMCPNGYFNRGVNIDGQVITLVSDGAGGGFVTNQTGANKYLTVSCK